MDERTFLGDCDLARIIHLPIRTRRASEGRPTSCPPIRSGSAQPTVRVTSQANEESGLAGLELNLGQASWLRNPGVPLDGVEFGLVVEEGTLRWRWNLTPSRAGCNVVG